MFKKKQYFAFLLAAIFFVASFTLPASASSSIGSGIPVTVTGLTMSSNNIAAGQSITLNVNTTVTANNVTAAYDGIMMPGVMTSNNGITKIWTVSITPTASQTVYLYVGAAPEINTLTKRYDLPVTVTGTAQTPSVQDPANVQILGIAETSVGKTVTLTVRTDASANNTWVRFDNDLYVQGVLGNSDSTGKTWTIRFSPSAIQTVTVSANTAYKTNGAANQEYTIEFTSSIAPPAKPVISNMYVSRNNLYDGEYTDVTIYTNTEVDNVWIKYDGSKTIPASASSGGAGYSKTWTVRLYPTGSQTIIAYANIGSSSETGAVSRSYSLTFQRDLYSAMPYIEDAYAEWDRYEIEDLIEDEGNDIDGYYVNIEIEVEMEDANTTYVWFEYNGNRYTSGWRKSGAVWTYSGDIRYAGRADYLTVYASQTSSSDYTYSDYMDVDIEYHEGRGSGGSSSSGYDDEIWDYDVDDRTVYEGDDIIFLIETGQDVQMIWIFDETEYDDPDDDSDGRKYSSSGYYDDDGDSRFWEIDYEAPSVSRNEDHDFVIRAYTDRYDYADEETDEVEETVEILNDR